MTSRWLPALVLGLALARISPAIEFRGTLVSSNGAPPIGKLVVLVEHHENRNAEQPDPFAIRCRPDKDGLFAVAVPKSAQQYMLFVMDDSNRIYKGFAHLDETTNFGAVAMQGGGMLVGTVQNRDRKPLADLELVLDLRLLAYTCFHYLEAARIRTDAQGAFTFANLSPGEYRYRPASDAYAAPNGTLTITEDPAFLNLILDKAAWLKGRIADPQGKPVAGITVRVGNRSQRSDAQGKYRLGGIVGGTNSVLVYGTGYVQDKKQEDESAQVICVPGEEASMDFTVIPAGVLRLTLQPADPDLSLPDELKIMLKTGTERRYRTEEKSASLKDRVAVFSNMAPGDFTITLHNEELPSVSTNGAIVSGQETRQTIGITKPCRYKGLVVDAAGKPVSEVTIMARPEKKQEDSDAANLYEMRYDGRAKETRSDDQGKFVLKGLTAGLNLISADHSDFMPTNVVVEIAGEMDATPAPWVMLKGLKVSGVVMDAEGKPALDYRVNLNSVSGRETMLSGRQTIYKNCEVGTNGAFEFKGLPPGKFRLSVADSDFNEITSLENVEAGSDDIIVTLAKTRLFTGTVVDKGGKPIEGVTIQAVKSRERNSKFYYSSSQLNNTIITDTNGHFEVSVHDGASYDIIAAAPPLLPNKVTVDLSPGTTFSGAPLKIIMAHGYKISGMLVAANGRPAGKGVKINVSQGGMAAMLAAMPNVDKFPSAETDAQGKFALDGVPPGIIILSVYDKSGGDANIHNPKILASKEVLVDTNKTTEVRIVLPRVGSIKGRVVPEEGKKAGVTHVSLNSVGGEGRLSYYMQSDVKGGFSFTNIPVGKYMAMTFGQGSQRDLPPAPEFIEVVADKTVEITLGQKTPGAGAPVFTGTVSKDNAPFQAGEISFMPMPKDTSAKLDLMALYGKKAQGKIGSNGLFSVKSLEPGEYVCGVTLRKPGKTTRDDGMIYPKTYQTLVTLAKGQTNLNIRFSGITLSGTVTGPDSKPVEKAYVSAAPSDANKRLKHMLGHYAQTDTQGQYQVECLPPSAYDVTVQHREYGVISRKNVTVSEKSNRLDFTLASGFMLTGTVATAAGGSTEGAWVILTADNESSGGFGMVDGNGTYQIKQPVPKGIYKIFIMLKGYALEAAVLNLATNTDYNATLVPGGDVQVTVRKQGKPVSGKTARIKATDGSAVLRLSDADTWYGGYGDFGLSIAATDEKGQTMIRALKPGKYTVFLDGEKASVPVDVKPLDTTEAALDL